MTAEVGVFTGLGVAAAWVPIFPDPLGGAPLGGIVLGAGCMFWVVLTVSPAREEFGY